MSKSFYRYSIPVKVNTRHYFNNIVKSINKFVLVLNAEIQCYSDVSDTGLVSVEVNACDDNNILFYLTFNHRLRSNSAMLYDAVRFLEVELGLFAKRKNFSLYTFKVLPGVPRNACNLTYTLVPSNVA